MRFTAFVPLRFVSLTVQFILTILIYTALRQHIASSILENEYSTENYHDLENQLIVALSLSLFCNLFEYVGIFNGLSTFAHSQNVVSTMLHTAGAITLIFFHLETWDSLRFWYIFSFCSLPSFLSECIVWLGVLVFKHSP